MDDVEASSRVAESSGRFRLLYELTRAFAARIEPDELFPLVVTKCREVFEAEGVSVLLLDAEGGELYFPFIAEGDPEVYRRLQQLRLPADQGIAGWVLQRGEAAKVDDAQNDPRFFRDIDRDSGFTTRTMLCAPLKSLRGPIGVIQVVNRQGGLPFSDEDLAFFDVLAGSVAVAVENARLFARVRESEELLRAQVGALRREQARRDRFAEMIGSGPKMAEVFRLMESAAASPIAVLIEGETGTGKELVARGIHRASVRAEGPFLAVNCAAVSETLLESELFGHRRGAFTGAMQDHRGLFEAASGGTILLDEIGEMPFPMQAKLLRVLQEGEVIPVGDTRPRKVDVRVISATNRQLDAEVARQTFRQDLYYRLAVFPIRVPPLRERPEDIALLVVRFLSHAAERHHKRIPGIGEAAFERLVAFDWPGNIRELENEIERAVALARDGESLGVEHLSAKLRTGPEAPGAEEPAPPRVAARPEPEVETLPFREARDGFEKRYIERVLNENGRNVSQTARVLGLSRVTLQKKMREFGLR
jgi:Nif-specific regulatory protein